MHNGDYCDSIFQCWSFKPRCDEKLKPKVGRTFEGLETVEELYKSYRHHVCFGARVGQQKKLNNVVVRRKPDDVP